MRFGIGATLAAAIVAGLLVPAADAWADTGIAGIVTADSGGIDVHLYEPSALWVQVTIRATTAPDAATLYQSDQITDYSDFRGWYTDVPIHLTDGTNYGDYPVDVAYRLPSGSVQNWTSAPDDPFHYVQHFGVASAGFDRSSTDFDHRSATLTGTVTVLDPKSASPAVAPAPAGIGVRIAWVTELYSGNKNGSTTAQTTTAGTFSAPITPGGSLLTVTAQPTKLPAGATANQPTYIEGIPAVTTQLRLTGGPTHVRVHAGTAFTVSGTVQRLTRTGWAAAAGVPVQTLDQATYAVLGSGTSDSKGHFAYRTRTKASASFDTMPPSSPYAEGGGVQGYASVPVTGSLGAVSFTLDAYQQVTAHGRLNGTCPNEPLQLQYSANGRSSWSRIATATATWTSNERRCSYTVHGPGAVAGYYRVVHPETDQMLSITSAKRRLARTQTRFASFAISPTSASHNAGLTATGQLQQLHSKKWRAYSHAHVVLVFRPRGDSTWYWVAKGYTSRTGRFNLRGKAYGTGDWGVYYDPDGTHFYSQTPHHRVTVR